MLGQLLNARYKLIEKIGEGGMALVFSAHDLLLEREVAVKILRPQFVADENFIRLFKREAKAAASLNHPRIVNVHDIGQDGDVHYLVMENIKGLNLKEYINQGGPLTLAEGLEIIEQICEALAVAHSNNLVHCDIKPHNILFTKGNGIKVTDFGIARAMSSAVTLTNTQSVMGSAYYISPEQAKGDQVTPSSDIYSLGVVAYELITGRLPFRGENPISTALQHIRDNPEPPSLFYKELPSFIERIILKAMEKNTFDRYADAEAMLKDVREALRLLDLDENPDNKKSLPFVKQTNRTFPQEKEINSLSDNDVTKKIDYVKPLTAIKEQKNEKPLKTNPEKQAYNLDHILDDEDEQMPKQKSTITKKIAGAKYYVFMFLILVFLAFASWFAYKSYMDVPIVIVPDLQGFTLEDARAELKRYKLSLTIGGDQYHDEIPKGLIVSQHPANEDEIRAGRNVTIILSSGPLWAETPILEELTLREAEVLLGGAGLILGEIEYEYSEEVGRDRIISQDPAAGEEIKPNTIINIVVSKGSESYSIRVPSLVGLTQEEAKETLKLFGLELGAVSSQDSLRYLKGQIAAQEPPTDALVAENSKVNIVLSTGIVNKEAAPVYPLNIRIPVPAGRASQEVKIVAIDNNGENIVFQEYREPGDRVFQRINTVGPTVIKIFINNVLAQEQKFGY